MDKSDFGVTRDIAYIGVDTVVFQYIITGKTFDPLTLGGFDSAVEVAGYTGILGHGDELGADKMGAVLT